MASISGPTLHKIFYLNLYAESNVGDHQNSEQAVPNLPQIQHSLVNTNQSDIRTLCSV